VAALAKERQLAGGVAEERVFVPGRSAPLDLPPESPESRLLQRIRDEAHRFAIAYHRDLRASRQLQSGLEEIPGIGPKRRRALLRHFGSLARIRTASAEELAAAPGMSRTAAEATHRYLHADLDPELRLDREAEALGLGVSEGAASEGGVEEGEEPETREETAP